MRRAILISPSRVSSSTVPISRMYMRTGSVVRPNSLSSDASAAAASSAASSSGSVSVSDRYRRSVRRAFVDLDAHVVDHADDVFDLLRVDDALGQVVVDLGIGQKPLFLALGNQFGSRDCWS